MQDEEVVVAASLVINCDVPQTDVKAFMAALARYEKETRRDMRSAVRSATIALVRSLRKRTRKAPKMVDRKDVRFGESDPKYCTGTRGDARGVEFRRVVVSRWSHGKRSNHVHWQPVLGKMRQRRGKFVVTESRAEMLRGARERYGRIRQWGLARKSWGWFMHALFQKSVQDENPNARLKSGTVEKELIERDGEISITIANKLDYIRKALHPGALSASLRAAANVINKKITSGFRSRRFGA